jgi:hypothetical protein
MCMSNRLSAYPIWPASCRIQHADPPRPRHYFRFDTPIPVTIVALLKVDPSRINDLRKLDILRLDPAVDVEVFFDSFGILAAGFLRSADDFVWDGEFGAG